MMKDVVDVPNDLVVAVVVVVQLHQWRVVEFQQLPLPWLGVVEQKLS